MGYRHILLFLHGSYMPTGDDAIKLVIGLFWQGGGRGRSNTISCRLSQDRGNKLLDCRTAHACYAAHAAITTTRPRRFPIYTVMHYRTPSFKRHNLVTNAVYLHENFRFYSRGMLNLQILN